MTVLYVSDHGAVIEKSSDSVIVRKDGVQIAEVEVKDLSSVVILNSVKITTPALDRLLRYGVDFAFVNSKGELLGKLVSPCSKNVPLRIAQYQKHLEPNFQLLHSRKIVEAKIDNQNRTLTRFISDIGENEVLRGIKEKFTVFELKARQARDKTELMGIEGASSVDYWNAFASLFTIEEVTFKGREKHPPPDPVNAVLSFGYVLLTNIVYNCAQAIGLDPYIGFYHELSYGRPALAFDLVEPFRAPIVDRLVVKLFNLKILKPHDFHPHEEGGVRMSQEALKKFFSAWEKQLQKYEVRKAVRKQCEQVRKVFLDEESELKLWRWEAR